MEAVARNPVQLEALCAALERVLSRHFETPRRIKKLRRRLSAYASSSTIENLDVELDGGPRLRLVLKDLCPTSLLATARQVRPKFLYEPRREIEVYRKILRRHPLGTPTCYGAVSRRGRGGYWLFLERVSGPLLWQIGRLESWAQAARWLARLHTECDPVHWRHGEAQAGCLLRYDESFLRAWIERAETFLRLKPPGGAPETWRRFARLGSRYGRVVKSLLELPATFIHGEFYPSNVILRRGRQVCPVDWEVAGVGPGLVDVAALISGEWTADQKKKMVAAYRDALAPSKGWPPSLPEMMEGVEWCQLHLAVQWLGWAPDWAPPESHAQNWLREALRLAEKLGL
jgi:hypothetical protein